MGQSDIIAKQYIQDNAVFADLFNYLLYDGSPTLKPEQLQSLDSSVTASLDKHNSNISLQRFRDIYILYRYDRWPRRISFTWR